MRKTVLIILASLCVAVLASAYAMSEDIGGVDGQGKLTRTNNPEADYDFVGRVDGQSRAIVRASKGKIQFIKGDASRIDGQSKVLLEAKTIKFRERSRIDGQSRVLVIISKGGRLDVDEINGQSTLNWCRASDDDPQPDVTVRRTDGGSKVTEIKMDEMKVLIKQYGLE